MFVENGSCKFVEEAIEVIEPKYKFENVFGK
jgi:hypothetical protein